MPFFAQHTDSITVTFNALEGNAGLANYTGDVYAHTGVITSASTSNTDWKYVKTGWGVNTPETKLTRLGPNLYEFKSSRQSGLFIMYPEEKPLERLLCIQVATGSLTGKTADGGDIFYRFGHTQIQT